MEKENLSYRVIITSPDGRFGEKIIEGGLNKRTALYEAKKAKEQGRVARVLDVRNKRFLI